MSSTWTHTCISPPFLLESCVSLKGYLTHSCAHSAWQAVLQRVMLEKGWIQLSWKAPETVGSSFLFPLRADTGTLRAWVNTLPAPTCPACLLISDWAEEASRLLPTPTSWQVEILPGPASWEELSSQGFSRLGLCRAPAVAGTFSQRIDTLGKPGWE